MFAVLGGAGLLGFEGGTVAGWITGGLMLGLAIGVPLLAGWLAVHLIFKLALARHRSTTNNSTWL